MSETPPSGTGAAGVADTMIKAEKMASITASATFGLSA
jgi:hypothetical protein